MTYETRKDLFSVMKTIKPLIVLMLSICCFVRFACGENAEKYSSYMIVESLANIDIKDVSEGVKTGKGGILKNGQKKCLVRINYKNKSDDWERVSFKFKTSADAKVAIAFAGEWLKGKDGKMLKCCFFYDDVKIDGIQIPNGGFENALKEWRPSSLSFPARIMTSKDTAKEGKRYLRSWSGSYVAQDFEAKKDVWYELSFYVRYAGVLSENDVDSPIDISKQGNFSTENLSELGAKAGLSKLPKGKTEIGGINFRIIDPEKNRGKNAVLFHSKVSPKGVWRLITENVNGGRWLYLLHTSFYSGKADTYNGDVIITSMDGTVVKYQLRRAKQTWLFDDSREKTGNVLKVWSADNEKKTGNLYLSKFEIPVTAADKIEIRSAANDAMVLLAATVSDKNVPTIETKILGTDKFTPVDMPDNIYIKEGSALDQSHFFANEKSGDRGRVILSERGTLAFEKTPEKDARFKGFSEHMRSHFGSLPPEERHGEIERYAKSFKVNGYNFARGTYGVGDLSHSPRREEHIDVLDKLLAEFKKNGVYVHHVWYRAPVEDYHFYIRDDVKLRTVFGDAHVRGVWKKAAEDTLNHVNKYTGVAFKDDPTIACVELYNELAICFSRMDESSKFDPRDTILPETKKLVLAKWRAWLKKRYNNDISALNNSWGKILRRNYNYKNFDEVECVVRGNTDWEKCCWDHLEEFVAFGKKVVRDAGYKGLIVQNNLGTSIYGSGVRSRTTDFVIFDTYFAHPSSFNAQSAACSQKSSIERLADYWRGIAGTKLDGRPFGVAEYNHCFWNKYRHEFPAVFAPYSAFQNFSTLVIHESAIAVKPTPPRHVGFFNVFNSPAAKVSELFSCAAFIRGDVKKSGKKILLNVSGDFLANNAASAYSVNSNQTQLSLLVGFASKFEGAIPESAEAIIPKAPDMKIIPTGSSEIIAEAWFHSVVDSKDKTFDLAKFVDVMRENKILSKENKTDIAKGIYQTDTGQITLDRTNMTLSVVTPKSEILAFSQKLSGGANALKSVSTSVPASVGLCALDGRKLGKSSRLVLTYLTREANIGMALSPNDEIAAGQGTGPVALENGILKAKIALDAKKSYAVYPLAFNGERRGKIPFEMFGGVMEIEIDNSKLKNGATPFFEIVAE